MRHRPGPNTLTEESVLAPYQEFAVNILWMAVEEWLRVTGQKPYNKSAKDPMCEYEIHKDAGAKGFDDPEQELLSFFESDWFEELSYIAGLDWRAARSALYNHSDNGHPTSRSEYQILDAGVQVAD